MRFDMKMQGMSKPNCGRKINVVQQSFCNFRPRLLRRGGHRRGRGGIPRPPARRVIRWENPRIIMRPPRRRRLSPGAGDGGDRRGDFPERFRVALEELIQRQGRNGGGLICVTSQRSPAEIRVDTAENGLSKNTDITPTHTHPFPSSEHLWLFI